MANEVLVCPEPDCGKEYKTQGGLDKHLLTHAAARGGDVPVDTVVLPVDPPKVEDFGTAETSDKEPETLLGVVTPDEPLVEGTDLDTLEPAPLASEHIVAEPGTAELPESRSHLVDNDDELKYDRECDQCPIHVYGTATTLARHKEKRH